MAKTPIYSVKFRRRREGRTNYSKRLAFLKSGKPRLVVRLSNKRIITQVVKSVNGQDFVTCSYNSSELSKLGWKHSFKNIPAAYLTGLALGKNCKSGEVILDAGVSKPSPRVFAVLKGFLDAGGKAPHSTSVFPDESRLLGKHLGDKVLKDVQIVKEKVLKHGKKKK